MKKAFAVLAVLAAMTGIAAAGPAAPEPYPCNPDGTVNPDSPCGCVEGTGRTIIVSCEIQRPVNLNDWKVAR